MRSAELEAPSYAGQGRQRARRIRTVAEDRPAMNQGVVGLGLALAAATISGISIFANSYAVKEFPDPTLFATLKNALVGLTLIPLLVRPSTIGEIKRLTAPRAAGLGLLGLIGGSIPFVLFFEGLARLTSGNAAFIHKTLFIWVAVLAVVFLRERVGLSQALALGLLLLATVLLGGPGALDLGTGAAMVLAATLLWSIEVVLAKRLLADISSTVAAGGRMMVGALLLLGYAATQGSLPALAQLTPNQWAWVAGTSALLLCYVTAWYAALERAPATAVTCTLTLGAPITALLVVLAGRPAPILDQMLGYALLLSGVAAYIALQTRAPRKELAVVPLAARGAR